MWEYKKGDLEFFWKGFKLLRAISQDEEKAARDFPCSLFFILLYAYSFANSTVPPACLMEFKSPYKSDFFEQPSMGSLTTTHIPLGEDSSIKLSKLMTAPAGI